MQNRPPDSRASAGQQIEDRLDSITDSMRRDTGRWIERQMRAAPSDARVHAAVIGGIAGGLLDELHELARGDADKLRSGWLVFVESYIEAQAEDAAADKEPMTGESNA